MPDMYTQEKRHIALKTPLGDDVLLLTKFTGYEEMSRLFTYELEMLSENDSIAPKDIVGKNVTIILRLLDEGERFFNGFVSRFSYCGTEDRLSRYTAEVVPWPWFLTMTADCRIFQKKTVPDIIEQIFGDLGFSDYELSLNGSHPEWEYCVQYRETDLNFVSRLMEQEGIFYYFKHEDGKHTMVLADHDGAYEDCPEKEVSFAAGLSAPESTDQIISWEHKYEFHPGKWAHTDYNFETPSASLMARTNTIVDLDGIDKYEVYDYPGEYTSKGDGDEIVKLRMEEEEVAHDVVSGSSKCRTFCAGGKFKIAHHHCEAEEDKGYVITSIQHAASVSGVYGTGASTADLDYENSFTCIPDARVFRPARTTPKPMVQGIQTAVVVGPAGEEIYTDDHARVKVQFHWDREGKKDENSSCWVRVSQPWAGQGWGALSTPRIGQEVVISFEEGDPDRPMITGRVYNAEQMPPYGPPGVVSGLKSNSTPGGGGYNEMSMDDTAGAEKITIHGQYNMDTTVENDQTLTVHNNRTSTVDVDDTETVGSNQTINVGADQSLTVGANQTVNVGSNKSETIGIAKSLAIGAAYQVSVGAAMNETVGAVKAEEIGGAKIVAVGAVSSENVGSNKSVNAGGSISEKAGGKINLTAGGDFNAKSGGKAVIEAASQLTLKCGGASIVLKSGGDILIKGSKITVKGSGDVIIKGSSIKEN